MEGILAQTSTASLFKCAVLFLFIFTAKVLTSRPHDALYSKNSHQAKPAHYVRTFTKYHHRRTIQWNSIPEDYIDAPKVIQKRSVDDSGQLISNIKNFLEFSSKPKVIKKRSIEDSNIKKFLEFSNKHKVIKKRSVEIEDSNEFISNNDLNLEFSSNSINIISNKNAIDSDQSSRNDVSKSNAVKKYKEKEYVTTTTVKPEVQGAKISCLYKTNHVAMRVTPSYDDDEQNAQMMVENDGFDTGPVSETYLPSGELVQVEQCTDPRAYCYTLWHQTTPDGNITVLGQGCWRGSRAGGCMGCTRVTARLPATKFCCCDTSLCNHDFANLQDETITMKVESSTDEAPTKSYINVATSALLALVASVLVGLALYRMYCRRQVDDEACDPEKGDIMGSGPDALATGLLCVDNLTLIEHVGQGKFGSVWRGTLGSTPVAVKLYTNVSAWQKEAAIYAMPHLSHPNLLRYYGSDTRQSLTDASREHLIVLELCQSTLRARLEQSPVTWLELATLAHGIASALAHLHTPSGSKPCIVHRDVNSRNVLCVNGHARLADLGLAQPLRNHDNTPRAYTEAGTLRYLSPEALEGALDLSEARSALCAVDVYSLGLVLWEMMWRCNGAHNGAVPVYAAPYHTLLPNNPTLHQMQSLVSRSKARPPLPRGPGSEPRVLRIVTDTCDECWDHDAEARLTAVCVEERMAELKQMLQTQGPVVHDNHLHPHHPDNATPQELEKNSNFTSSQNCDVTTPLLYPHPHIGRNACIERNTHNNTSSTVQLIHKSLKDISVPTDQPRVENVQDNCLSVARVNRNQTQDFDNSDRLNEIRSYQRPLDYVQNDVSVNNRETRNKQTNLLQDVKVEKSKWGIRKFFEKKLKPKVETEVKLLPEGLNSIKNGSVHTGIRVIPKPSNLTANERPPNLILNANGVFNYEVPCTLSPPNRTLSPTMMLDGLNRENRVFNFKELPQNDNEPKTKTQNQIFAVIVPKAKPTDYMIEIRNKAGNSDSDSTKHSVRTSMSSQSIFKSGHSESSDSTSKKPIGSDRIIASNSGRSSRASINLELQYIGSESPYDLNTDCSSSEDEQLLLLSENGGSKITMQTISKEKQEVLKEASKKKTELGLNKINKYSNFDNEFSDPHDKENLVNYSGDNPVYLATLNGEIYTEHPKFTPNETKSPKPSLKLKNLAIRRQHSLEQIGEIFTSSGDVNLQNPAGRVKTPGDIPVAIRRARSRALQKGRANEANRLSLYDDRMMFGNSL